ncbi:paraquat-inducible protein A [Agaribacter flavus]
MPRHIPHRTVLSCPRCKHTLAVGHRNPKHHVVAVSITAIVVMIIALSFSFISFSANGQNRDIYLLQASSELFFQEYYFVAAIVLAFIVILPVLYLCCLSIIILNTQYNLSFLSTHLLGRIASSILPWAMTEVFLISVLVALIKIVSMAEISLNVSFWAYVVFATLFTYVVSIVDNHRLWQWVAQGDNW